MNKSLSLMWFLGIFTFLFVCFLYGPFVVVGILSFQQGPEGGPQFPVIEWSSFWYKHVFGLTPPSRIAPLPIGEALIRSLSLAFTLHHCHRWRWTNRLDSSKFPFAARGRRVFQQMKRIRIVIIIFTTQMRHAFIPAY